jgi:NAD(P)-dependent dehydrogenase (short-subunit alcohol dehydrogenase family)
VLLPGTKPSIRGKLKPMNAENQAGGAVVIGAGPGIGLSVARRFAREGLPVAVLARSPETVEDSRAVLVADGAEAVGVTADAANDEQLRRALDDVQRELGTPQALIYNVGLIQQDRPGELSADQHLAAWSVNVGGAITAATHVAPAMMARGSGSIIFTGGMPEPLPDVFSLSLGKAGVRALTVLLAKAYGPRGVHVATVTVGGAVAPDSAFDPDGIAEHYWRLHSQPSESWEREVLLAG